MKGKHLKQSGSEKTDTAKADTDTFGGDLLASVTSAHAPGAAALGIDSQTPASSTPTPSPAPTPSSTPASPTPTPALAPDAHALPVPDADRRARSHRRVLIGVALVLTIAALAVGAGLIWLIFAPQPSGEGPSIEQTPVPATDWGSPPSPEEQRRLDAIASGVSPDNPDILYLPTPLVATYADLQIHSPICVTQITEVEYHQASYDWALQLNPLLTLVDAETVMENHGTHHVAADEQPVGDNPMIGEAVSTWRLDSEGPELSAVDVGAAAGTTVYAPATGTVVRIREYVLFEQIDDYELHIQINGHPEWDIIVLHIDNLVVQEGDKVIGGVTPIAQVRNIGDIIDNNLSNFTIPGETGNHAHVQVNDARAEGYRGLEGAIDIPATKFTDKLIPASS
ncbi:MAG: M23 family metallopeptidase [Coriobacteriales bacterium]|nr:M23 family metallopeptidase [Coriobacteriales bacterium]